MIPQYLVARVRERLAEDPRTNLLDIQVKVLGAKLFLIGSVESAERRAAAEVVAREVLPRECEIVNELWVMVYSGAPTREDLPP